MRVGERGDRQEARANQAGPHVHLHPLPPPLHLLSPNMAKRKKRNKKTEEENKDDLEKGGSLRMTRGTNAHLLPPPVGAGQTASHMANQGGPQRQRGKFVTQSILFKRTIFQTQSQG